MNAVITGIEAYVPKDLLTNADLSKMVDTTDEWIMQRVGIKERHILKEEGKGTSDLAVPAVKKLLDKKGLSPKDIDLIICATVTPDMLFPATANVISDKLGIVNAIGFDLNAACSGFINALVTASKFITSGDCKKALVIGADNLTSFVNYTDRTTCALFGDGAGVALLEGTEEDLGIQDYILESDGSGRKFLHMKAGGSVKPPSYETIDAKEHSIYQEGQAVFKFAVSKMADTSLEIMRRNNITPKDLTWLVPIRQTSELLKQQPTEWIFREIR